MSRNRRRRPKVEREPDIKFIVADAAVNDSVLPVSYCLSDQALNLIKYRGMLSPHMLILVAERTIVPGSKPDDPIYSYEEVSRQLVPLKQGMFYVQFPRSGNFLIKGLIVNSKDNKFSSLYTDCIRHQWEFCIDDITGTLNRHRRSNVVHFGDAALNVTIGKEFFAKQPSGMVASWVNLLFADKPADQCQFRKRALFSVTVQPLMLLVWLLLLAVPFRAILAVIATILGYRPLNYAAVWQIRKFWFFEIFDYIDSPKDSIFLSSRDGKTRWFAVPFYPLWPTIFIFLSFFRIVIGEDGKSQFAYLLSWENALYGLLIYLGIVATIFTLIVIFAAGFWVVTQISDGAKATWNKLRDILKTSEPKVEDIMANRLAELEYLACQNRAKLTPSLEAIPAAQRTLHLRFLDMKAKVCRPYQT